MSNMKSFVSISTKFIFLVLAISISSIAITTALAYSFADTIIKDNIQKSLKDESETRGQIISSIIETRITKLQSLSQNDAVQETFRTLIPQLNDVYFDTLLQERLPFIQIEVNSFQLNEFETGLRDLKIINLRGKQIFSLNEKIDPIIYEKGNFNLDKPKTEFIQDSEQSRLMKIALPVNSEDSGNQVGIIIATMGSSVFDDVLLNKFGLHKTGEVYLVNKDKMMISESLFYENAEFNQKVDTVPVSECFENGKNIQGMTYQDYRNADIFGFSYCNKDLGFVLLTEVDESDILEPITELQNRIIIVGISLIIITSGITFVLSRRITKPILKLRDASSQLTSGNFNVRTNIRTNDEIEQLSIVFDNMAKTIQETVSAISKRENIIKQQQDILLKFSEEKQQSYVCLVDLVDSIKITESLTEDQKRHYNQIFIESIIPAIKKYHGITIKEIGDAILFYFPISKDDEKILSNVLSCCLEISQLSDELNQKTIAENLPGIAYRISSTFGTINVAKTMNSSIQDIFGGPVNVCFKINQYALPNTVVFDSTIHDKAKDLKFKFTKLDQSIIKDLEYSVFIVS